MGLEESSIDLQICKFTVASDWYCEVTSSKLVGKDYSIPLTPALNTPLCLIFFILSITLPHRRTRLS